MPFLNSKNFCKCHLPVENPWLNVQTLLALASLFPFNIPYISNKLDQQTDFQIYLCPLCNCIFMQLSAYEDASISNLKS